ncbi:hypothetical protein DBR32_06730 [Taibaiella sp. KBW10]|uniref:T9SS type A sorting domain-containing protein n=1 Tax=Taibaiella sp. KBW10 TaxID=2153357 RepID=UPI000F5A72C1|nr:T9SS type A sorting domain-containing protein [Taibaiella sp. KBW10]RQO31642.1 hypothetical protein DBR32_06730 [Taibaiella sp. KBW10]
MKIGFSHIILFIILLSGTLWVPFRSYSQINSTSVLIMPSPVIDSVGYQCIGSAPVRVYVSNQISPCIYSIENTIPVIAPVPDNNTGAFYNVYGITDAVFRVNNGACYTDYAVHFDCNGAPLPVTLTDFSAILYQKNKALLSWTVTKELDIREYELEQSIDGISFEYLSTTRADGQNSDTRTYTFIDEQLTQGYNFYRLKIVAADGAFRYSPVRFVIYSAERDIVWYPNPTDKYIYFEFYNEQNADMMHIEVYNSVAGSQWIKRSYKLQQGVNKIAIDVSMLADGMYHMVYAIGDHTKRTGTIKFDKITR